VSTSGLLAMAQPHGLHAARIFAALAFLALLAGLAWGLLRARRQLAHDEADAALEREFRQLEREASVKAGEP
jgi:hypothetical protein